ncbi:MAG: glycoside hydrolase family 36 protein [Myxococcota bacterium]|nr:glycoside hydrolase family 36 protein [Myxococcota bacterium]
MMHANHRLFVILLASLLGGCSDDAPPEARCPSVSVAQMEWTGDAFHHSSACGELELRPRILGEGDWTVDFDKTAEGGWQPTLVARRDGVFRGLILEGRITTVGESPPVFWRQGYQSWSWSGVTVPGEPTRDAEGVLVPAGDGDGRTVFDENDFTSWWVGLVGRHDGTSLLFGVQGATQSRFFMGIDESEVQLVWGHRGERWSMTRGESLVLDPLWVGAGTDAHALHRAYAKATVQRTPVADRPARPPTGWATWYQYYADVTEEDVRSNLTALTELSRAAVPPVDVFQIDDGWQVRWGDWWAGDDFPSGMTAIAADIAASGMTPGLWLAPFYMSTESETFQTNPDWWVRDAAGEPIVFTNLGTGEYVILDVTHPDAADWLSSLMSGIVAKGYEYLKLDFLYAGAMVGTRHQDVTGIQAYRLGMEIIRDAVGDAWILACGAPLVPSVGLADSFRTGADIAFESWTEPHIAFYRWQARSTAARAWTQATWWWMDPDQVVIRTPLSDGEVTGAVASALVAAGTWMLGDDLVALGSDRLTRALDPSLTALLGQTVRPDGLLQSPSGVDPGPIVEMAQGDDRAPHRWELEDGTIVLLNLQTEPVEIEGPGGTELFSGEQASPGPRSLEPGTGEVWSPN